MLRFIYVTDLHGWIPGYEATIQFACRLGIKLIVNGGDMLPKGESLESSLAEGPGLAGVPRIFEIQARFLHEYLHGHFERCQGHGVRYLAMFGNDDLRCHYDAWRELSNGFAHVAHLAESWHDLPDAVLIRGCPYVPDVPFRLKDWALRDDEDFVSPPQLSQPVLSTATGLKVITDVEEFFDTRSTLEAHLESIARQIEDRDMRRAIFVGHSPPASTGLAVVGDGTDVGSRATTRWIQQEQPLLTLHGHIHESPDVSGIDTTRLGRTVCHNPGQAAPGRVTLSIVTIDQENVEVKRILLPPDGESV